MNLSTRQQQIMDEIHADTDSAGRTLTLALTFHSNCLNDIGKRRDEIWHELAEQHDLDLINKIYEIKREGGFFRVVEQESLPPKET